MSPEEIKSIMTMIQNLAAANKQTEKEVGRELFITLGIGILGEDGEEEFDRATRLIRRGVKEE